MEHRTIITRIILKRRHRNTSCTKSVRQSKKALLDPDIAILKKDMDKKFQVTVQDFGAKPTKMSSSSGPKLSTNKIGKTH